MLSRMVDSSPPCRLLQMMHVVDAHPHTSNCVSVALPFFVQRYEWNTALHSLHQLIPRPGQHPETKSVWQQHLLSSQWSVPAAGYSESPVRQNMFAAVRQFLYMYTGLLLLPLRDLSWNQISSLSVESFQGLTNLTHL